MSAPEFGDVTITEFLLNKSPTTSDSAVGTITGASTSVDLSALVISAQITESIFTNWVEAVFEVTDFEDVLSTIKIDGSETITFNFTRETDGMKGSYTLVLNSIRNIDIHGPMTSLKYFIHCISHEAIAGQANEVQKSYKSLISSIASDVISSVLEAKLPLDIETTKGERDIKLFNQRGADAVELLRREAVSAQYPSSNYMFYITQKAIHFKSLEAMMNADPSSDFIQKNAVGANVFNISAEKNIISWTITQRMNIMNAARAGLLTQVTTTGLHTLQFTKNTTNASSALSAMFGSFNKAQRTVGKAINNSQDYNIPQSQVPGALPDKNAYIALMTQNQINMTVYGVPILQAGQTIHLDIPKITSVEDDRNKPEPVASGKWLISKLQHDIRRADVRPRYLMNLECIRDRLYA